MNTYRPNRVVSMLTAVVSIAYFGLMAVAIAVLTLAPIARLLPGVDSSWEWGLNFPAVVHASGAAVHIGGGDGQVLVEEARGHLFLPLADLPWRVVVLLWTHAAVMTGLTLLCLHHLRRIFQRVRDGAPFDLSNALRMRRLGLLLLTLALISDLAEFVTGLAIRGGLEGGGITVATMPRLDLPVLFVALVLVALAEVFRHGAVLEHEQSLVI